jgi:hypothetical protein
VRKFGLFALIQLVCVAACGGGGGPGYFNGSGSGGGGGGGGGGGSAANVATIVVDGGPSGASAFNTPYVTVTVCAPGSTTNCQTIDHIEVDTGSYGLRLISKVVNSTLLTALPMEMTPGFNTPIVECTVFGDGYSWGSMRTADMQIAGEKASSLPIQIIGDPQFTNIPKECSNQGMDNAENSVATFGANGILGVGPFVQDCGDACANGTQLHLYYSCPTNGGACSDTQVPNSMQALNPVASFTTDNNGVIVQMPAVADAGAATPTGSLVFGIDTQGNNGLGSAKVLTIGTSGASTGYISVDYKGTTFPDSFIDSGSNLNFFNDSTITTCQIGSGTNNTFFCPSSELSLSATNIGVNNVQSIVSFKVANAQTELTANQSYTAFDNVAAPNSDSQGFDFGFPFFYGRNVYTAIDGMNTSGGMGPYFAY